MYKVYGNLIKYKLDEENCSLTEVRTFIIVLFEWIQYNISDFIAD